MVVFKGAVALVTGASSGIGEGVARMLASQGAKVSLVARRAKQLEGVAAEIRGGGGSALVVATDLLDDVALQAAVERTQRELGPVDILVNASGEYYASEVHALDAKAWDRCMALNLRAPTLLCAAVLPGMRARRRGFIVNIASEAGSFVYRGLGAYAVSKHALRVLTELIQRENQSEGIKSWAICPGYVDTAMAGDAVGLRRDNILAVDDVVDVVRTLLAQGENVKMGPEILIRTMRNPYAKD